MSWFVSVSRWCNANRSWRKKRQLRDSIWWTISLLKPKNSEQGKESLKFRLCNGMICRPARDTNLEEDNKTLQEFLIPLWIRTSFRIIFGTQSWFLHNRTLLHDDKKTGDSHFYFFLAPIASQLHFYPWLLYYVIVKITTLFERRENWLQTTGSLASMEEPGDKCNVFFALIVTGPAS